MRQNATAGSLPHAMRNLLSQLLAVGPELAAFILTLPLLGAKGASAITLQSAPSPNLDLSQLGRVAVAGDFDSISLYQYAGQNENVYNNNGSQSLLTRYPGGGFDSLGLSDAYIESMCYFKRNGKVVLGGNFTSVAGTKAESVALWDPSSGGISPLTGINGKVSTVYCDNDAGVLYVGGMFTAGNSSNAMAYTKQWQNLPFAGFNGPVNTITKNAAGNIVFGGLFDGLGTSNGSTTTTPNTQVVNLAGGNITASGTSTTAGFDDPTNIICRTGEDVSGDTWLLADNTGGWFQGDFSFGFIPTKLRLYNTKYQGRGTKMFYLEDMNMGGILNLNYIDANGQNQSCENLCPLPKGNTSAQDFYMKPTVGMSTFRLWITEWYGDGGGLSGIELFQDDIYSFAVNDYNEPKCDDLSNASKSTINPPTGFWEQIANNGTTSSDYLSAYLTTASQAVPQNSVIFTPNIQQSGNYSILIYTPGCIADDSCATRGTVNLTGSMTTNGQPISTTVTQTNDYDKFDQIYYGPVDVDSAPYIPSVTLAPLPNQPLPQTIVAQRVRFDLVTSTGGLNGLFEYDPNKATINTNFKDSVIDTAGTKLATGAVINSIQSYGNDVYVAGMFSGDNIANIMTVGTQAKSLPNGGLNDNVQSTYLDGSMLYAGGNFTGTSDNSTTGLHSVAAFDIANSKWVALGAGVNGQVDNLVPVALNITGNGDNVDCITVNGEFTSVNGYGGYAAFSADGFAVWVPSRKAWLNNFPNADVAITGKLITTAPVPGLQYPLYAGQISSQADAFGGAAELVGSGSPDLQSLGIRVKPATSSSSMRKRAVDSSPNGDGVYTGLYYDDNGINVTVLGGHFAATASDGSTVENLMFVRSSGSTQTITGVTQLDTNSTVAAMDTYNTLVFAGGSISGNVNGNDLNGLVVYDLQKKALASPQPPALGGDDVVVNTVASQPDSSSVYVGGNFKYAGSLPCAALCYYDASTQQWNTPGTGLSGTITSMFWSSNTQLFIAGSLTVGGNKTNMATYDSKKQTFTQYTKASLPGAISALTPASSSYDEFWAAGIASNNDSAYLSKYSDDSWVGVGGFGPGTVIRGLQILSLTSGHGSTDLIPSNDVLMVTGNINVPNFGNASAVLFNGTDFEPFLLTNKDDGSQGTVAGVFVSNPQDLMKLTGGSLAVGFVVLIGLAIALALIFLIVVAGILIERARRRREGYVPMSMDKNGNLSRIPPETLLGDINGEKGSPPKV